MIRAKLGDGSPVSVSEVRRSATDSGRAVALTAPLFAGLPPLATRSATRTGFELHRCTTNFDRLEGFARRGLDAQRAVDDVIRAHSAGAFDRKRKP